MKTFEQIVREELGSHGVDILRVSRIQPDMPDYNDAEWYNVVLGPRFNIEWLPDLNREGIYLHEVHPLGDYLTVFFFDMGEQYRSR